MRKINSAILVEDYHESSIVINAESGLSGSLNPPGVYRHFNSVLNKRIRELGLEAGITRALDGLCTSLNHAIVASSELIEKDILLVTGSMIYVPSLVYSIYLPSIENLAWTDFSIYDSNFTIGIKKERSEDAGVMFVRLESGVIVKPKVSISFGVEHKICKNNRVFPSFFNKKQLVVSDETFESIMNINEIVKIIHSYLTVSLKQISLVSVLTFTGEPSE